MRELKKIARFVMELILAISIIAFLLVNLLSKTILKQSYFLSELEKSNYYDKTYELVKSNFENYIQQSGLDDKILENIVTKEQIEEDTKKIITSIYDGLKEEVSTKNIKKKLEKNINKQIEVNSLSTEQKKAIDDFVEKICEEYKATISNSDYELQINDSYKKIMKYVKLLNKGSIISIGISVIIIILLNLKRNYKILTNIGISLVSSGVILAIVNFYISSKIKIQYITILNEPISEVIRSIAQYILSYILKYGLLLAVTGLVLIVVTNFIHNIVKYKSLMNDEPQEND